MHKLQQALMMKANFRSIKPELLYLDNEWQNTGAKTTYNFLNKNFGSPSEDRVIAICFYGYFPTPSAPSSVTIGGVAATIVDFRSYLNYGAGIAYATVPAGSTGTVSIVWGGNQEQAGIVVYSMKGLLNKTHMDFGGASGASTVINLDVVQHGPVLVAQHYFSNAGLTYVTIDYDGSSIQGLIGASVLAPATVLNQTVQNTDGSASKALVAVSWR